jgi:hypothetical protein
LASELLSDVGYQHRLRRDFTRRRVHSSIETLIWHYVAGKPKESIEMTGSIGFSKRLEAERELFGKLSLAQLEELSAESQALVNKAAMMVRANASPLLVGVSPSPAAAVNDVTTGEPTAQSQAPTVSDQHDAAAAADIAPRDTR